jgi:CheY-like chemotaxis protein
MKVPVIVMTGLEMPVTMREEIEETHPGTEVMFKSELGRLSEQVKNTLRRYTQNAKIMVVDDNRDYSQTISAILSEKGYVTATADSPEECLLKAKEEKPDLVLLDIMMPGSSMRARDVVEGLKMMEGLEKTPVIYLSGVKATDRQKKELVESGFVSGFIEKPVNESELLRSIREVLKGRKDRP